MPNGIPDESTFERLFRRLKPGELHSCLHQWLADRRTGEGRIISIDGKTVRGSASEGNRAVHIVSAWQGEQHLVLGQLATEEKSNEITAISRLLDMLEVAGDTITIDAADYNPRGVRRP